MYYSDWKHYMDALENVISQQRNKIKTLEEQLQSLEQKIQELQEKPGTNIEKMEYHFDQLKIETLEGTLNIGLSPEGLTASEQLSIPGQSLQPQHPSPQPIMDDLMQSLQPFMNQELPRAIQNFARENNQSLPPGFQHLILQDITRQLPERIQHYTRLHSENNNGLINESTKDQILKDVKSEIMQSVQKFIEGKEGGAS
ncbi:spore germination protein PC [Melghiribacillus thermohalophilus]|uniref:Spore germination protein PC n=1 Tax=Melghiribacillus thermohalophilus TaxID=1324956 RepID=A0A4R3MN88_9BACI|nr:spore germination protein GerPC [Melghiribacillus thermohalophilus]TCT16691.1 spore germination protein PC [Melghiribacillus thermohalophilus]